MHYSLDTLTVAIHHEAGLTDGLLRRVAGSSGLLLGTRETAAHVRTSSHARYRRWRFHWSSSGDVFEEARLLGARRRCQISGIYADGCRRVCPLGPALLGP